jgi:hypothetical protein
VVTANRFRERTLALLLACLFVLRRSIVDLGAYAFVPPAGTNFIIR